MAETLPLPPLFREVELSSAEELLDEFTQHRGGHLWERADHDDWVFRGQSDAAMDLKPRAQRGGKEFLPFEPLLAEPRERASWPRRAIEHDLVSKFASHVSFHGMEVPGDSQHLRDHDTAPGLDLSHMEFPHQDWLGMYALAQHYGIPTRLLDWTHSRHVASYFACRRPAEKEPGGGGRFAVWALQRQLIELVLHDRSPGAILVTVPTSSNPNLAAQKGLFTLVRFRKEDVSAKARPADIPTLDALVQDDSVVAQARTALLLPLPMLFKFTVPVDQARRLLFLLDGLDVNAASLYPGPKGVVDYMREKRFYAGR